MISIINDCISIMDFLCYQLEKELHDNYRSQFYGLHNMIYELTKKIGEKELINHYKNIRDKSERYYPSIHFKVDFDFSSNRLNVDCSSHRFSKKQFEEFKQYWEEPIPYGSSTVELMEIRILRHGYNVGKFNKISTKQEPLKLRNGSVFELSSSIKYPRYEDLRALIYQEIENFKFHYGYSLTVYDEDTIRKELIERLRIKIFQGYPTPKCLYREFNDGNWKKISLSHG